jgi:hypothetical protein
LEPLEAGGLAEVEFDGDEVEMLLAVVWVGLECSARLSELSESSEESSLESSCDRLGTKILRFDPATKGPLDMLAQGSKRISATSSLQSAKEHVIDFVLRLTGLDSFAS